VPWTESSVTVQRVELVEMIEGGVSVTDVARVAGVSRKTALKWWRRYQDDGVGGLVDRSRARVTASSQLTSRPMVDLVVSMRVDYPTWGGRKIGARLIRGGVLGVPAASTITEILRWEGLLEIPVRPQRDLVRFEADQPNDLWQIDFKGDFGLGCGERCYPLTMIDDHARFVVGLQAVGNQQRWTVRDALSCAFERYGTPRRILCDHGPPWGASGRAKYARLGVWLLEHGIDITHGRPRHPQTQGKDERFHRTLGEDVLRFRHFDTLSDVQKAFDEWLPIYNTYRPHQALGMDVPSDRYQPSPRPFTSNPQPPDYPAHVHIRRVNNGTIRWNNRYLRVGHAFDTKQDAITEHENRIHIHYYNTLIRTHPKDA